MPDSETTALRACVTIIEYSPPLTGLRGDQRAAESVEVILDHPGDRILREKIAGDLHSQVADVATVKAFFPCIEGSSATYLLSLYPAGPQPPLQISPKKPKTKVKNAC